MRSGLLCPREERRLFHQKGLGGGGHVSVVLLQLSVKVAGAAPARGVCPGWEVSVQGDPRAGWEGSDSGSGRQDVRPALLTRGALGGSTGRSGWGWGSQGGAEAAEALKGAG